MNDRKPSVNWNFKMAYSEAGFTLNALAERSGIGRVYLSQFANGKYYLSPEQIEKLALILDVPVKQIAGNSAR